jgi:hypothetical protein
MKQPVFQMGATERIREASHEPFNRVLNEALEGSRPVKLVVNGYVRHD